MKVFRTRKRKVTAVLAVVAVAIAASAAYAAWFVQDDGEGKTRAASLVAITVNPSGTVPTGADQCFPGGTCDAHVTITNPNAPLVITAVAPATNTGTSSSATDCPHTNLTVEPLSGLAIPLPSGTSEVVLKDAYRLSASAPNACQGVTLTKDTRVTASTS